MMTDETLDKLDRLERAATKAPWEWWFDNNRIKAWTGEKYTTVLDMRYDMHGFTLVTIYLTHHDLV